MSPLSFLKASEVILFFVSCFDEIHVSEQNSTRWEAAKWMPGFEASHLGLFCLPMSHKKDARLISVKFLHPKS